MLRGPVDLENGKVLGLENIENVFHNRVQKHDTIHIECEARSEGIPSADKVVMHEMPASSFTTLTVPVSASQAQLGALRPGHLQCRGVGQVRESADLALQQGEDGGDVANLGRPKAAQAAEFPRGPAAGIRRRMSEGNRRIHAKGSSLLSPSRGR